MRLGEYIRKCRVAAGKTQDYLFKSLKLIDISYVPEDIACIEENFLDTDEIHHIARAIPGLSVCKLAALMDERIWYNVLKFLPTNADIGEWCELRIDYEPEFGRLMGIWNGSGWEVKTMESVVDVYGPLIPGITGCVTYWRPGGRAPSGI